jgi:hypothetical protein
MVRGGRGMKETKTTALLIIACILLMFVVTVLMVEVERLQARINTIEVVKYEQS